MIAILVATLLVVAPIASAGGTTGCATCETGKTSIESTFNGESIRKGHTIWFSVVFKPKDRHAAAEYRFEDVKVSFKVGSSERILQVPSGVVKFSSTATKATTSFDTASGKWRTTVPVGFDKPVFLTGLAYHVPHDLPGGIKPVTVSGKLFANKPGLEVQWKWAAAVYTCFASTHAGVQVKPVDGDKLSDFKNSDHAGTPENFKEFVTGGARGGGGSNYTGSLSGTKSVVTCYKPECTTTRT